MRVARPDHSQPGEIRRLAQKLPAGDKRLKDDIAETRALIQHLPQGVSGDFVHLAVAARDRADDGRKASQMRDVAGKLAWTMDCERLRRVAGIVDDLDLARLDNEEFEVPLADRDERFPIPVPPGLDRGATGELRDLGLLENREGDGLEIVLGHRRGG